jgi:hypothetical protein
MRVQLHKRIRTQFRSGGQHLLVPNLVRYRTVPNNIRYQNRIIVIGIWTLYMSQSGILRRLMFF